MPFNTARRIAYGTCALAVLLTHAASGADIGGSIHFSDENFAVAVRTIDRTLELTSRGCNTFDLILLPAGRNAGVQLRDRSGRSLGTIGNDRTIETRTCGAGRYTTDIIFAEPTLITWTPQADELVGGKRVKYAAQLTPTQMRFDPAIELTVFEPNSHARPLRIVEVASAEFSAGQPIAYSASTLHFPTVAGEIARKNGFAPDDEFFLESESQRFARPSNGDGEQIRFEAVSAQKPTSISLYYPPGGPHIVAFTADERVREPTSVKSLRVDDEQLLTPQFAITRADPITIKRGFLHFASGDLVARGAVQVVLGSTGSEVTHIRVSSSDPTRLEVGLSRPSAFSPSIDIATAPGGTAFDIATQVRVPANSATGARNFNLLLTSDGGLKRTIPVTLNVMDPYAHARSAALAALVAILIAAVTWTLIKRRRTESQAADSRAIFFQKHYGDYSELREHIEAALASDVTWLRAAEVLEELQEKQLEIALTPQQWNAIRELAAQHKAREALETLDRALVKLEG